jgi:hypothetical protein
MKTIPQLRSASKRTLTKRPAISAYDPIAPLHLAALGIDSVIERLQVILLALSPEHRPDENEQSGIARIIDTACCDLLDQRDKVWAFADPSTWIGGAEGVA